MSRTPRTRRVIIDTDAKNEADDQFAIVHALLSETLDVRGIIAAHFGTQRSATSMLDSRAEIDLLLGMMGRDDVRAENGAAEALPDEDTPVDSPGARLIIEEARRADAGPLQIAFLGPLTDMAAALLLDPALVETDTTVIWIGGPGYEVREPGEGTEFNLRNDVAAANVVFRSGIRIWQVPRTAYVMSSVGYAELDEKVAPCGELGAYLVRQLKEFNETVQDGPIEHRALGDSPAVGLMLNPLGGLFRTRPAPLFSAEGALLPGAGHTVRVCEMYDARYLLEDFFAKLRRSAAAQPGV
ncbi:nucleoside hydrolase [Brachybacterium phenoliresistens]|uniref:Nucleoside hydrolase n=1 Tax=Brachybacterium phenoliresistens TaxID=396014 RepID=Z9JVI5_9MICO|nr:nucleoside hydrolase [Brachybacterium phenoliresistens]EWS82204.1 nucleoside hydrolase [Brachybacterium phenoliresistens]